MSEQFGLIGSKLGHSFSSLFFNEKFRREGMDASYALFPISSIKEVSDLIKSHPDLRGFNVTIPYKEQIIPFLDTLSDAAKEIGAVNVVKIEKGPGGVTLHGYNTDWIGFMRSLDFLSNDTFPKALILGSGGASKAVRYALRQMGISYTLVSHSAAACSIDYNALTNEIFEKNRLIINTTPLGMFPDTNVFPPLPYEWINDTHFCYDLIYNPAVTEFMRLCAEQGASVKNGLQMLRIQAEESWRIWSE